MSEEIERIKERKMREMEEEMKARVEGEKGKKGLRGQRQGQGPKIDHTLTLTDNSFVETVRKYPLIVVDCWAPWCGPCKMVAPVLEELAKEYAGRVVFGKLNVDENPRVATEFGIMAIPTLFIFKNGEPVDVIQGALPKQHLEARVKEWL
ncbi:MAG: thioredoxin [Methanophagales archaeon]|nr:thioredoxin [Methanophagales archaeon]PXF51424.1 MAG: thioredoxin [Methanophagales archaeon]